MKKSYKAEEEGRYGAKLTVMQPTVENVSSENVAPNEKLCESEEPIKYRDCPDYNSEFCRQRCEFGAKEKPADDDVLLPDMEDGK